MDSQEFQSTKCIPNFTRLRFSVLRAWTFCGGFRGIPENSEPTLICGLGQIFLQVHRPHCATPPPHCNTLQHIATHCTILLQLQRQRTCQQCSTCRRTEHIQAPLYSASTTHKDFFSRKQHSKATLRTFLCENTTQKHHSKAPLEMCEHQSKAPIVTHFVKAPLKSIRACVLLLYTHRKCYLKCAEGGNSIVHARRKYYLKCAGAGNSLPYTHIESIA